MRYTITRISKKEKHVQKLVLTGTIPEIAKYFGKRYRTYEGMKRSFLKEESGSQDEISYCIIPVV